jgi:hypothetical protein
MLIVHPEKRNPRELARAKWKVETLIEDETK